MFFDSHTNTTARRWRVLLASALFAAGSALAERPAVQMPRPAPEYSAAMPGGSQILLSRYRGKVVVLEFLLTTCPHCQTTSRLLEDLQQELGPRGVQVIGVAINEQPDVAGFRQASGARFPIGLSSREPAIDFLQLSLRSRLLMPQLVLLDRAGTIRGQYAGDDPLFDPNPAEQKRKLKAAIETLLRNNTPAKPAAKPRPS